MNPFSCLSQIDVNNPASWQGTCFLSFDIDWAHDDVLRDAIALVEQADVHATWFVTHDTPLLAHLRRNPKFELGIHPNFNELLMGRDTAGADADQILATLKALVPEARTLRSHSLVQSERLVDQFHQHGITHVSNFFIPETAERPLWPWQLWDGMTAIPHGWQDNVSMRLHGTIQPPPPLSTGLRVVDFHPIHVFLNTERVARYESARAHFRTPERLQQERNQSTPGARDILNHILGAA
ncbi:MAG: hypothetical protein V4735_04365 [Pseudomonadota bacterium]